MPQIRYKTNDVPQWGTGAFNPVPGPTPLASTGGEQLRLLQQYDHDPDPDLAGYSASRPDDSDIQGSYANAIPDTPTHVAGLPLAFRPVVNRGHQMRYWTKPTNGAGRQTMGPNGVNTHMKIWSDNPLPIPAQNPGRVAMPAMRTVPAGTIIATAWPRPFLSWPTWGQSRQS
jgi:hypothetical protein